MKRIVVFSMLLLIAVLTLQAQTPIAGWEIKGMGFSEDNLINVETVAAIIVVQGRGNIVLMPLICQLMKLSWL